MADFDVEQLTCAPWYDLGGLQGMVDFCTHVKVEQQREVAGMTAWLQVKEAEVTGADGVTEPGAARGG